jgi:hypothetical protein
MRNGRFQPIRPPAGEVVKVAFGSTAEARTFTPEAPASASPQVILATTSSQARAGGDAREADVVLHP